MPTLKIPFANHQLLAVVAACLLACPIAAKAGIVFYSTRAAWQMAAGPASFTENFSGFAAAIQFRSTAVALNGMTIREEGTARPAYNEIDVPGGQFSPNSGSNAALLVTDFPERGSLGTQVRIAFNVQSKAFGLESWSASDGEGISMEVYSGATLLGARDLGGGDGDFLGFVLTGSDTATSVRFRSIGFISGMVGERFYIDNLAGVVAGSAPVFETQPASRAVVPGSRVVFNAAAPTAASYQWERDGIPLAGATSDTLVIESASALNVGSYVVVASNLSGSTSSVPATLTLLAALPVFSVQPISRAVAIGSTVVFTAAASGAESYRWERNGVNVAGASSSILVINSVSMSHAGTYVSFATNPGGTTASAPANLTVLDLDPLEAGRLVNLSILAAAGSGAKVLTLGATVGAGDVTHVLPLVIRAVGPTLAHAPFSVPGVLSDPEMTFYAAGNPSPIDSNDNWGGSSALVAAFRGVGAFELPVASLDSALARTSPGLPPGGYTVQVAGKGGSTGLVLAEIYDAAGATRSTASPRLTNLSTEAQIDPGGDLTVGFVVGGRSARTLLVRGVGPSLAAFGIGGLVADPRLELFDNGTGQRLATNDDWAGSAELVATFASVGAFALGSGNSKDAVLLVTLPPGPYSARTTGAGGDGGTVLVEVYEIP